MSSFQAPQGRPGEGGVKHRPLLEQKQKQDEEQVTEHQNDPNILARNDVSEPLIEAAASPLQRLETLSKAVEQNAITGKDGIAVEAGLHDAIAAVSPASLLCDK